MKLKSGLNVLKGKYFGLELNSHFTIIDDSGLVIDSLTAAK